MKTWLRRIAPALALMAVASFAIAQIEPTPQEPPRLPNGRDQRTEILKAEHEQNLKDAAKLVEMAEDLKRDLEKNDRFVLSLATLKKTDDIEKLVRKIRARMRHN